MKSPLRILIGLALCLAVSAYFYRHTLFPLDRLIEYHGDCAQMVWNLWITDHNLSAFNDPFLTKLTYWPVGANLAHHTLASGYFPLVKATTWIWGHDIPAYIVAYNLCLWISTALTLFFSFRCLRELEIGPVAAIAPALAFTMCPFLKANLLNLNHVSAFFIPLCVWLSIRLFRRQARGDWYWLCAAGGTAFYFTEFIAYLALLGALTLALALVFAETRSRLLALTGVLRGHLVTGPLLAAAIAAPFLYHFYLTPISAYDLNEHSKHSANLAAFFVPSNGATNLYGTFFQSLSHKITIGTTGARSFLGFPLLGLGVAGIFLMPRRFGVIVGAAVIVFATLSLGPLLKVFSDQYDISMPYRWIMDYPPLRGSRTPDRLLVIALFMLALAAGHGLRAIGAKLSKPAARHAIATIFAIWVAAETLTPAPQKSVWTYSEPLERITPGPVMPIPFEMIHGFIGLSQIAHEQPTLSGPVVRLSPQMNDAWWRMHDALKEGGARGAGMLAEYKVANILILPTAQPDDRTAKELTVAICGTSLPVVDLRPAPRQFPGLLNPPPRKTGSATTGLPLVRENPIALTVPASITASSVECSLRQLASCELNFYRGTQLLGQLRMDVPAPSSETFVIRLAALPATVAGQAFDRVVISTGDPQGELGHLHFR